MRLFQSFFLCLVLMLPAVPVLGAWNEHSTSPKQTEILKRVETLVMQTENPVVIFDLDSTLYKNYNRWAVILREFGKQRNIRNLKEFKKDQISDSWDMKRILKDDAQLAEDVVTQILPEFKNFWGERFFNNKYIRYDEPLPGAVAYVNRLYKMGATIVYITGRDIPNMRAGTVAKLKADGFPVGVKRTLLLMHPKSRSDLRHLAKDEAHYHELLKKSDTEFKKSAIEKVRSLGTVVACFENEPRHINEYYKAFHKDGKGLAVFLDTDHSKNPPPVMKGVVAVNGFLY